LHRNNIVLAVRPEWAKFGLCNAQKEFSIAVNRHGQPALFCAESSEISAALATLQHSIKA
jgi:hypothetical protein